MLKKRLISSVMAIVLGTGILPLNPLRGSAEQNAEWQQLYADQLKSYMNSDDYADDAMFDLYDIDGNGVPELAISEGAPHVRMCLIYTVYDGELLYVGNYGSYGTVSCSQEHQLLASEDMGMGYSYGVYYSFSSDGSMSPVFSYGTNEDASEDETQVYYQINGVDVSQEAYAAAFEDYDDINWTSVGRKYDFEESVIEEILDITEEVLSSGDVNGDGAVNAVDAAAVLAASAAEGSGGTSSFTASQKILADVNGNEEYNAKDAAEILRYAAAVGTGYQKSIDEFLGREPYVNIIMTNFRMNETDTVSVAAVVSGQAEAVEWTSSKPAQATVTGNNCIGYVYGVSGGYSTITASITVDGIVYSDECVVYVKIPKIEIEMDEDVYAQGETAVLSTEVDGASFCLPEIVQWESSDTSVVTVSSDGTITAVDEGTAEITVYAEWNGETTSGVVRDSVIITVFREAEVYLSSTELDLYVGDVVKLAAFTDEEGAEGAMSWHSTGNDVVNVSDDGTVTAVGTGTAIVTVQVTTEYQSVFAQCTVNVNTPGAIHLQIDTVKISESELAANDYTVTVPVYLRKTEPVSVAAFGIDMEASCTAVFEDGIENISSAKNPDTSFYWMMWSTNGTSDIGDTTGTLFTMHVTISQEAVESGKILPIAYIDTRYKDHYWGNVIHDIDYTDQFTWTNGGIIIE